MIFRFYFQTAISLICILGILIWSDKGYALLVFFALLPIIMRMKKTTKPDERELQLFYKIGNIKFGGVILVIVLIENISDAVINGNKIGNFWGILIIMSIVIIQGITGLIIYKTQ